MSSVDNAGLLLVSSLPSWSRSSPENPRYKKNRLSFYNSSRRNTRVGFFLVLGVYPEVRYSGRKTSIGIYVPVTLFVVASKREKREKQIQALEHAVNYLVAWAGVLMDGGLLVLSAYGQPSLQVIDT